MGITAIEHFLYPDCAIWQCSDHRASQGGREVMASRNFWQI